MCHLYMMFVLRAPSYFEPKNALGHAFLSRNCFANMLNIAKQIPKPVDRAALRITIITKESILCKPYSCSLCETSRKMNNCRVCRKKTFLPETPKKRPPFLSKTRRKKSFGVIANQPEPRPCQPPCVPAFEPLDLLLVNLVRSSP